MPFQQALGPVGLSAAAIRAGEDPVLGPVESGHLLPPPQGPGHEAVERHRLARGFGLAVPHDIAPDALRDAQAEILEVHVFPLGRQKFADAQPGATTLSSFSMTFIAHRLVIASCWEP